MSDNQPDDEVADQEVVRRMSVLTTTEAPSPTIKTGELTKRSGGQIGIKNWRKRWFVLTRWEQSSKIFARGAGRRDDRR